MKKIFFILIASFLLSSPCLAGEWNQTGSMNQGREGAPSGILDNGDVLAAGGWDSGPLSSCEIFSASSGQWEIVDSMNCSRYKFSLTKFRENDINKFLAGGGTSSLIAEVFDTQSMLWTQTGSMHYHRSEAPAIAFPDPNNDENDLVLFVGGDAQNNYRSCEIYNPATGLFSMTGWLIEGKCGSKLVYNPDLNLIMAIGGWGSNGMISFYDCEIYNITTGIWTQIAPTNYPHEYHTANYNKQEETILVVGSSYSPYNACELYSFATAIWTPTDTLLIGRWNHCSESLLNKETLVIGGHSDQIGTDMTCEIYSYENHEWQMTAPLIGSIVNNASEILEDERVLAIGKYHCATYTWNHTPVVSQLENLSGLAEATVGQTITFAVTGIDPDGDSLMITINWGDSTISSSTLVPSGTTLQFQYSWSDPGQYQVRAQAADQWYFLNPLCHNSLSEWSEPYVITISGNAVDPNPNSPEPILFVYPNPFRNSTTISFSAQVRPAPTEIKIFNIRGQVIKTWSFNQTAHEVVWNGKDDNGKKIAAGIYFCKSRIGSISLTRKIILLK